MQYIFAISLFLVGCATSNYNRSPAAITRAEVDDIDTSIYDEKIDVAEKNHPIATNENRVIRVTTIRDFLKHFDMEKIYFSPAGQGAPGLFIPVPEVVTPLGEIKKNVVYPDFNPTQRLDAVAYYFKGGYFSYGGENETSFKPFAPNFVRDRQTTSRGIKGSCVEDTGDSVALIDIATFNNDDVAKAEDLPQSTSTQKKERAKKILAAIAKGFRYVPIEEKNSVFQTACFNLNDPDDPNEDQKQWQSFFHPTRGETAGQRMQIYLVWKNKDDFEKRKADRIVINSPTGWFFWDRTSEPVQNVKMLLDQYAILGISYYRESDGALVEFSGSY